MSKKAAVTAGDPGAEALPHLAEFARRLRSASREAIASDLLLSLSDRSGPIPFAPDPSPERQLFYLFNTLEPAAGERLKAGTTRAIAEWSAAVHGYDALRGLAFLAAYVRALSAGSTISRIVLQQLSGGAADAPRIRASLDLLRVLLGFPPDREFSEVFSELLFADSSPEAFWGLCFVGACKHDTSNFRLYAARYIDLLRFDPRHGITPDPEPAIHRLVAEVTFRRLAEVLPQLGGRYLQRIMKLLCSEPWSPATFYVDEYSDAAYLVDSRPYVSTSGSRHLLPNLSTTFLDLMIENTTTAGPVADANRALKQRQILMRNA